MHGLSVPTMKSIARGPTTSMFSTVERRTCTLLLSRPFASGFNGKISKRSVSFESMNRAVGKFAADQFVESMTLNSKIIVSTDCSNTKCLFSFSNCFEFMHRTLL
jgi:hypothetical protein